LSGEFVFGINNLGHILPTTPRTHATVESWDWARDPQSRIDFGYRATHVNALVAKALIRAYYGQEPHYSYLMGCSEGGREALNEVQRYPNDFDGVSAGSPAALQTAQETTAHLWIVHADRRADGTNILMPEKRKLAHDAVLRQCDTFSGLKDGLLQDPRGCHFNPASLQCASASTDTSGCLTAEEVTALQKIYAGASDEQGDHLMFGLERGGETQWGLPDTPTAEPPGAREAALSRAYMILPEVTPVASDFNHLEFTRASFELGSTLSPLYDAANTDLRPFATHGGKLILWHGLSDFEIPPKVTLAYYRGVQKFMGVQATERFVRLFLLPGVGHCRGGDGYDQLDVLSALMAWIEMQHAPTQIMTGKANRPAGPATNPAGGPAPPAAPFAMPMATLAATRPVYPYPYVARYSGQGDPASGASYLPAMEPSEPPPRFTYEALRLIGPDNQHNYAVKDGRLVVLNSP
jgi:feruloyl esterase